MEGNAATELLLGRIDEPVLISEGSDSKYKKCIQNNTVNCQENNMIAVSFNITSYVIFEAAINRSRTFMEPPPPV